MPARRSPKSARMTSRYPPASGYTRTAGQGPSPSGMCRVPAAGPSGTGISTSMRLVMGGTDHRAGRSAAAKEDAVVAVHIDVPAAAAFGRDEPLRRARALGEDRNRLPAHVGVRADRKPYGRLSCPGWPHRGDLEAGDGDLRGAAA